MRLLQSTAPTTKILGTALITWKTACVITGSTFPLVVVSSGSMEPTFYRGDLIFLWNRQHRIRAGDIPVVWFDGRPLPMVHRAIQVSQQGMGGGDNNAVDDTALYPEGQSFVYRENVVGLYLYPANPLKRTPSPSSPVFPLPPFLFFPPALRLPSRLWFSPVLLFLLPATLVYIGLKGNIKRAEVDGEALAKRQSWPGIPDYNIQMCQDANVGRAVTVTQTSTSSM
ncbi:hypothetical protein LT330_006451 [Penicillium expansum]|nr:hypothetical protein LT330_006451 [Penicillium expansum]